ncbi:MAG: hypothetical protein QOF90_2210, partial [Acetobacteraceae bacterium]|nr:hypothetical protein [Acetobacteraceae bacterium]
MSAGGPSGPFGALRFIVRDYVRVPL